MYRVSGGAFYLLRHHRAHHIDPDFAVFVGGVQAVARQRGDQWPVLCQWQPGHPQDPLSNEEFFVTTSDGAAVGSDDGIFYTNSAGEIVIEGLEPGTTVTALFLVARHHLDQLEIARGGVEEDQGLLVVGPHRYRSPRWRGLSWTANPKP